MATKSKKTAAKRITAAKAKAIKGAKVRATKATKAKAPKAAKAAKANGAPKAGTKISTLIEMVSRKDGATTAELCKALGWLPHTLRAAICRLPTKPTHSRIDGVTSYRIGA